ncbi:MULTISPECIES: hypothetical protein [Rhizobium/Agrobacterium group]|uniref:Uncharacterized protein n=2 Tax=Agrobacterium TaxID=357 RepID=A0A1S7P9R3_9HYPH|nr:MULTISPECIES: hypothetical protein [Rhizobium/Agrobacterium group]UXT21185.1 hypothetical protein FY140_16860 [Agrobacterium tumefaciens]CUX18005.1 hypothetical protein AGR7C_Cc120046 [Agrobacterium deltaense Zutra 3/1]
MILFNRLDLPGGFILRLAAKTMVENPASNHTSVFKTPFFQGKFPSISVWIDLRNADTLRAGQPATAMTFL